MKDLQAPFPYFGGKSVVADRVWDALGRDVGHYIEPFCGSCAVLLARGGRDFSGFAETINDKYGFVANAWRAMQHAPDEVARWCDWPVNHCDLTARKAKLVKNMDSMTERLMADSDYFDAKIAGYWIWVVSSSIGAWEESPGQIPLIGDKGKGIHKINIQWGGRPHLTDAGQGVHGILNRNPQPSDGRSVQEPYNDGVYSWMRALSERLRYVRVVCGDWTRVCGGNWQDDFGTAGIFFDPPYAISNRDTVYHEDSQDVAHNVRRWAIERGKLPSYRIVIAGYDEHHDLLDTGWRAETWKAHGGYQNIGKKKGENLNRFRECLYFSPHCLERQMSLIP